MQEIERSRGELLAIEPGFTIERFLKATPIEQETDRLHYAEGLRRAGISEGDSATTALGAGYGSSKPDLTFVAKSFQVSLLYQRP
jgi:hypothetical protein